ncbi:MAG: hypothetical protein JST47_05565 [Bacteroidetes bacterium]|nr:hypothetical protein [Bacteroidota bacterium]MBS1974610.1 hypothetical protein [Bacteroidota bacterium]
MKKALAISKVLSWGNLVIGSIIALLALLSIIALPAIAVLLSVVLIGCVVLHSYAAIQLQKSIVSPATPLNKQTPIGIRMMGYMALFFAIMMFSNSIFMLQNTKELIKQVSLPSQLSQKEFINIIHFTGAFVLLFSLSIIINVIVNFRLLRWYFVSVNNNNYNQ